MVLMSGLLRNLRKQGYDDAQELVDLFTQESTDTVADYSDLNWPEATWNFACSTTETSTWADGGRKFGELMEKATGGKDQSQHLCGRPADQWKSV